MAQEYEVTQFKKGDFQDPHGNYWCDMALKGVGEPVRIVVKDPTQFHDGMSIYGNITDETSKAGKPYQRFRREQRPDDEQPSKPPVTYTKDKPTEEYWEDKNSAIKAQWAIGQAIKLQTAFAVQKKDPALLASKEVEDAAKYLFGMVERVKGTEAPKAPSSPSVSVEDQVAQEQAKRDADLVHAFDDGTPVNLDDIPF